MAIQAVITAKAKDIGGFAVRRALPTAQLRAVGPFVFLDQMGPARIPPGGGLDVRPHPHIGLSTLTYLYEGEILHRDSLGTVQLIQPGAVNWMTAGRGIAHSERSPLETRDRERPIAGLQFWVALPRMHEEIAPSFHHLERDALPLYSDRGVEIRLIAGRMAGAESPLPAPHPMIGASFDLQSETSTSIPPEWSQRALYIVAGQVEIAGTAFAEGQLVQLEPGSEVPVRAAGPARMVLIGGEPLESPRHIWWNFVSSSQERIEQAKQEWKAGLFAQVPGETEFIPLPE
jgi:redox-sensitive bicupin YhaK (pirin superfamily)